MSEAISLKEHNAHTVGEALDSGNQVARRPPTNCALQPIHRFACAVKLALAGIDSDDTPLVLLSRVNGYKRPITTPAYRGNAVFVCTGEALINLFRNRRVAKRSGASPLELGFPLTPSNRDVLRSV